MAPIICGGPRFVIQYFVSVYFCNHLDGEERAGWFALTVFLMSCDSQCSVALPHGALGWSVVYDCYFLIIITCFFKQNDKKYSFLNHQ